MNTGVLQYVPKEILDIIAHEQLRLLSHKIRAEEFSLDELRWLMKTRRSLSVMYSSERSCCVETCVMDLYARLSKTVNDVIRISSPITAAYLENSYTYQSIDESYPLENEFLEDRLPGRVGPRLFGPFLFGYGINYNDAEDDADGIILDIKSIWMLLRKRALAQQGGLHRVEEVARHAALQFLAEICDHYKGRELLLKEYLASSALLMELDVEIFPGDERLTESVAERLREICAMYRSAIEVSLSIVC